MPNLKFQLEGAEAVPCAATPLLHLKTRISSQHAGVEIQNILLQCQIQIEPTRRAYDSAERDNLRELFGASARWGQTLRPLLWTNAQVAVPAFEEATVVNVPLPCTFDFNVAVTKYLNGLQEGDIPLCVLFSGSIFYTGDEGALHIAKIPWDREANYRLPVRVWKEMMDAHYPNSAWLCLQRDVLERIYRYKMDRGLLTWEQALESLLAGAEENTVRKSYA
jgi:uncharacterized protein DUF6084